VRGPLGPTAASASRWHPPETCASRPGATRRPQLDTVVEVVERSGPRSCSTSRPDRTYRGARRPTVRVKQLDKMRLALHPSASTSSTTRRAGDLIACGVLRPWGVPGTSGSQLLLAPGAPPARDGVAYRSGGRSGRASEPLAAQRHRPPSSDSTLSPPRRRSRFWRAARSPSVTPPPSAVKLALGLGFALLSPPFAAGPGLPGIFLPGVPASVSVIGWYWTLSPPIPTAYSVFMGT